MDERVQAIELAYEDTTVKPVMDTISRLDHWTITRHRGVCTDKPKLRTLKAWCRCVDLRSSLLPLGRAQTSLALLSLIRSLEAYHLSGVLFTLQKRDNIFTGRNLSITVLKGGTDTNSIYGEVAVSVLTFGIVTS